MADEHLTPGGTEALIQRLAMLGKVNRIGADATEDDRDENAESSWGELGELASVMQDGAAALERALAPKTCATCQHHPAVEADQADIEKCTVKVYRPRPGFYKVDPEFGCTRHQPREEAGNGEA